MLTIIRGAGDIASGIALRLFHAGFSIAMTDIAQPTTVRKSVAFSRAITQGSAMVEDVCAFRAQHAHDVRRIIESGRIAVLVDPDAQCVRTLHPDALIDAILAKQNLGTMIGDAPIVIGIGPGFTAGVDCHAAIETQRGHFLGRVILDGQAAKNTGVPGEVGGYTVERVFRAPCEGVFCAHRSIGDEVKAGETVATVDGQEIRCEIAGILRGILDDGISVYAGMKCGDVDPRCAREHCFTVSDKALSVGGGVLEAILRLEGQDPGCAARAVK